MTTRASTSSTSGSAARTRVVSFGGNEPLRAKATNQLTPQRGTTLHDQPMPFSTRAILRAWENGKTVTGGDSAAVRSVTLNGRDYIIKKMPSGEFGNNQARNEEAMVTALRDLGWSDLGPREAYHVVQHTADDRQDYLVQTRERGVADNFEQGQAMKRAMATNVSPRQLQRAYLAEYTLGMRDRHAGNVLYDAAAKTVRQIDFADAFPSGHMEGRMSAVREVLLAQDPNTAFSRADIEHIIDSAPRVEATMRHYGLLPPQIDGFRSRVNILATLLRSGEPVTLSALRQASGYRPFTDARFAPRSAFS